VHSFDGFVNYDIGLRGKKLLIKKVSPLARFDYMSDHSDGVTTDAEGCLATTDWRRGRLTAGMTLSLATPFVADIRLNYEKYFYRDGAIVKPSEHDKIVVEIMTRF
ncbi:MAG: porin, partial [Prevotella sp.]